ncbi:lipoamide dehydrogenase 1 [Striga asiatica]|uniref:Lipoamide dehydrogenase 1 n=1 Tax=Striga asiatica TaxID=4170 RepID=A0A5A7PRU2_STRAF|nr:lipoamide dehydrogenase 1 [Striga asiatica]
MFANISKPRPLSCNNGKSNSIARTISEFTCFLNTPLSTKMRASSCLNSSFKELALLSSSSTMNQNIYDQYLGNEKAYLFRAPPPNPSPGTPIAPNTLARQLPDMVGYTVWLRPRGFRRTSIAHITFRIIVNHRRVQFMPREIFQLLHNAMSHGQALVDI